MNGVPAPAVGASLPAWTRLAIAAGCICAYMVLDVALRPASEPGSHIMAWYPSAGVGLAMLLILGPWSAPLLFAARFTLVYWVPPGRQPPLWGTLLQSAVHVAIYTAAASTLWRAVPLAPQAWRPRNVARLIVTIAAAAIAAAVWSAVPLLGASAPPPGTLWLQAAMFAAGDAIGGFIVVPLLLFVILPSHRKWRAAPIEESADDVYVGSPDETPRRPTLSRAAMRWERVAQVLAGVAGISLIWLWRNQGTLLPGYGWLLCFLPVFWVAQREGVRGAAIAVAAYGTAWIVLSLLLGVTDADVHASQPLLISLSIAGLLLGAARTSSDEGAARYWNLIAATAEGVWRVDRDGRTLYVNSRMAEILGREVDDIIGHQASEFIAPESVDAWRAEWQARIKGRGGAYETRGFRPDGTRADLVVTANALRSALSGEIVGSVAIVTDVTALRQVEASERRAANLLQAAFHAAHDALSLFRAGDELIVDVNEVWCELTGFTREKVVGRSQKELGIWADPADSARLAAAIREHGLVDSFEIALNHHVPGGPAERRYALLSAHPVRVEGTTYILVAGRDITMEKRAGAAQSQAQRLEALGRLAGGIAHDFNNLLTVVAAYAQMARANIAPDNANVVADMTEIERACQRGAELSKRLLAFSRQQPVEPRPVDLNELLEAARPMLQTIGGSPIALVIERTDHLPPIMADPGQVDQVLLNLAVNARDAMPNGGELHVRTRAVHAHPGQVRTIIGPDALPGEYVELAVTDTGVGMDEATRLRAFEPFFSTKAVSEGTGLGLSVVSGIVQQARGVVRVTSVPGGGSTFTVFWPAAVLAPVPSSEIAGSARPSLAAEGAQVLVVEDDHTVREIIRRMLEDAGYRVVTSENGLDAMGLIHDLTDAGDLPDVVLSDIVMPGGVGGYEFARWLAPRYPTIPIILMSGVEHDEATVPPTNVAGEPIAKPFDVAVLRRAVASAIERTAANHR